MDFLAVDNYISDLFAHQDAALQKATASIKAAGLDDMSISPNQGSFLQLLARAIRAKTILEIGTFAGYSTIWLARALPPQGRLVTLEYDPHHAALARDTRVDATIITSVGVKYFDGMAIVLVK